jgi:hypothetical protein
MMLYVEEDEFGFFNVYEDGKRVNDETYSSFYLAKRFLTLLLQFYSRYDNLITDTLQIPARI